MSENTNTVKSNRLEVRGFDIGYEGGPAVARIKPGYRAACERMVAAHNDSNDIAHDIQSAIDHIHDGSSHKAAAILDDVLGRLGDEAPVIERHDPAAVREPVMAARCILNKDNCDDRARILVHTRLAAALRAFGGVE